MNAAALDEADARQEQTAISTRNLARERDEIVKLMEKDHWPGIVFGSVAAVGAVSAGIAGQIVLGGGIEPAAFAAPALIPAVYAALRDARTKPDFGQRPMAYAALATRRFGP